MYCKNCGKELSNGEIFCSSCGNKQNEDKRNFIGIDNTKKSLYAFYISIITSPLLFIIRMLGQTSKHIEAGVGGSWRSHDVSIVPSNIQAIMILILIASTLINIMLRKNISSIEESKKKNYKIIACYKYCFWCIYDIYAILRKDIEL